MEEDTLDVLRAACVKNNITLEELVISIDDARRHAEVITKGGDVIADHSTRLKAVQLLAAILQVPLLAKASALKKLTGMKPLDVNAVVEQKKQLEGTSASESKS